MLAQIRKRLETLEAPDRFLDSLIVLFLLGFKSQAMNAWVLKDDQTRILCFMYEEAWDEKRTARIKSICQDDGREFLYAEYEGVYLQFSSRLVPKVTTNVQDAIDVIQRAFPEYTGWSVDSDGKAMLWSEGRTNILVGQNKIPAVALIDAILNRHFDKVLSGEHFHNPDGDGVS